MQESKKHFTVGKCMEMFTEFIEKGYATKDSVISFTVNGVSYAATTGGIHNKNIKIDKTATGEIGVGNGDKQ